MKSRKVLFDYGIMTVSSVLLLLIVQDQKPFVGNYSIVINGTYENADYSRRDYQVLMYLPSNSSIKFDRSNRAAIISFNNSNCEMELFAGRGGLTYSDYLDNELLAGIVPSSINGRYIYWEIYKDNNGDIINFIGENGNPVYETNSEGKPIYYYSEKIIPLISIVELHDCNMASMINNILNKKRNNCDRGSIIISIRITGGCLDDINMGINLCKRMMLVVPR